MKPKNEGLASLSLDELTATVGGYSRRPLPRPTRGTRPTPHRPSGGVGNSGNAGSSGNA
jgi:hypothetical protein